VSEIAHKSFVAVDEAGTEAAAASYVRLRGGGPPPLEKNDFVADQ
jgi:serine protease inhibitor